jgi:hypothetical protein
MKLAIMNALEVLVAPLLLPAVGAYLHLASVLATGQTCSLPTSKFLGCRAGCLRDRDDECGAAGTAVVPRAECPERCTG